MPKTEPKLPRLIDADALGVTLEALASRGPADSPAVRAALLGRLKDAMLEGRAQAERLLKQDGLGTACARRLSDLQDTVIQAIFDFAAERVYPSINRSAAERLAVVAVGGYGRGTLAPGSDIDLLFLLPYKQTPWGESVVEYILYMLWDLGLKVGHATRSVDECMRQARGDMTIRTAVLEARYIWGDKPLFDDLQARFDREVVKGTGPEFIAAKLAERDQRHQRTGSSRYLVEPNVKDGKGGLRDLHTLFWIGKYFFRVESGEALVAAGVFSRAELNRFRKCEDFLWAIRCHLHFMTGRAEERLSFELQRDMAVRLGYTTHPGLRDVERFMKHYFLIAKEVGDLTRIFCAALEERHGKPVSRLNRFLGLVRSKPRTIESTDFIILNERISIADPAAFSRDPVNLLRIFEIADRTELAIHPDALKALARSLPLIDHELRENEEANRLFVAVLTSRRQPETVLRLMNETGVLGRFIPDFGRIVSMMQFNLYHHYTVDEHLIRAIGMLSEIERGERAEEHPLSNAIIGTVDRTVLYVALFLHDIAKGRPEDHSLAGARVARRLCPRLGLSPADTALVAWLVEHHLDMSMVAQSRDLGDRKTILDFAAVAQNIDRLKLLTVLTVADIKAVGPGVWNGWKGQLLRTLYYEVEPVLTGGHSQVSRDRRVRAAKAELAASLADWPEAERAAYLERHYPAYWLRVDLPRKLVHAAMIREADRAGRTLATRVATHDFHAVTEITILAPDHPRLLSIIAGACTLAGANIVDAQIFTTVDGAALDTIFVSREFSSDADEERRAGKIGSLIEDVLTGRMQLPEVVASRVKPRPRLKAFSVEPRVITDNSWSNQYTAIEASGLDRPGLLYDLTHAISDLNLNIGSAHVATFGERVVDVFYVTDLMGQKIINRAREANIRARLLRVWSPPENARAGAAAASRPSVPA